MGISILRFLTWFKDLSCVSCKFSKDLAKAKFTNISRLESAPTEVWCESLLHICVSRVQGLCDVDLRSTQASVTARTEHAPESVSIRKKTVRQTKLRWPTRANALQTAKKNSNSKTREQEKNAAITKTTATQTWKHMEERNALQVHSKHNGSPPGH